jgi:hypothetical protein
MLNDRDGVPLVVATARVEVPDPPEMDDGLKLQEGLGMVGHPLAVSPTVPVKPPEGVIVTVYLAVDPRMTDVFPGEAEIEKLPGLGALTWSVTVAMWEIVPLVALRVML